MSFVVRIKISDILRVEYPSRFWAEFVHTYEVYSGAFNFLPSEED